jgi:hypothetical protein
VSLIREAWNAVTVVDFSRLPTAVSDVTVKSRVAWRGDLPLSSSLSELEERVLCEGKLAPLVA